MTKIVDNTNRLNRLAWLIAVCCAMPLGPLNAFQSEPTPAAKPDLLDAPAFLSPPTEAESIAEAAALTNQIADPNVFVSKLPIDPVLTFGRSSLEVQQMLQPVTQPWKKSVVQILGPQEQVILGTIVSASGLIVAKHSELPKPFECLLHDGTKIPGKLIGIHPQNDLALIQIEADNLSPVPFELVNFQSPQSGELVVSVGAAGQPVGFGTVIVRPHIFSIEQIECTDCIDLGAVVSQQPEIREFEMDGQTVRKSGLKVSRVYPRTAAESTGLLVGDLLQTINGTDLVSRDQLNSIAKTLKVGQQLTMQVIRDGQRHKLSTQIKSFSQRTMHDRWGGGPYSARRFGFSTVVAHDSVVAPQNCGSPLVTLDGQVWGINVARSMRVATFAIPMNDVYYFVTYVRPNAELNVTVAGAASQRETPVRSSVDR